MLSHTVKLLKLGHFRWSGLFSYQTIGTLSHVVSYLLPPSDRNRTDISSTPSKSNLIQLFQKATCPQCYHIWSKSKILVNSDGLDFFPIKQPELFVTESAICIHSLTKTARIFPLFLPNRILFNFSKKATCPQCYHIGSKSKIWVISDGLDFFPIKQPELFVTESATCFHPLTGTARIFPLFLPNRIFWNFSHKPHFHNAIIYGQNLEIGSISLVWTFFLSNNRKNLLGNQLPASIRWPEPHGQFLYSFQIESSSTFFTSHISTMLSHTVKIWKLGHFRWSVLFSYQTTGTFCHGISYLHPLSDRRGTDNSSISSKSNLLELFSQATFPQCYHIRSKS